MWEISNSPTAKKWDTLYNPISISLPKKDMTGDYNPLTLH